MAYVSNRCLIKMGLKKSFSRGDGVPTSLAAYQLIQRAIPNFSWRIVKMRAGKPVVEFRNYPRVGGYFPSIKQLVDYSLGIKSLTFDLPDIHYRWNSLLKLGPVGEELARLLQNRCHAPHSIVIQSITDWLHTALKGIESTIFSVVCPDWEIDAETKRYTFKSLNDGVGLVASRILDILPSMERYIRKWHLPMSFSVAIGDFEATNLSCSNLGITKDQFLARLRKSQDKFSELAPPSISLKVPFMTDLGSWDLTLQKAQSYINFQNFSGPLKCSKCEVYRMAKARTSLYERWYGKKIDPIKLMMAQGAEYAAIGQIVVSEFSNPLVIAGDHEVMAPFWQALQEKPLSIVYLKGDSY